MMLILSSCHLPNLISGGGVRLFKVVITFLVISLSLHGCAYVTVSERVAAEKYLKKQCLEAYLSSRTAVSSDGFGYQYWRYKPRAFAVANYGGQQVCGWYAGGWGDDRARINNLAINSCNKYLPSGFVCELFAVDDSIVGEPPTYTVKKKNEVKEDGDSISNDLAIQHANDKCKKLGLRQPSKDFDLCMRSLNK